MVEDGTDVAAQGLQLIAFKVGPETYCLDILNVREIIHTRRLVRNSMTSGHIDGVINLYGGPVPVVSLRRRLGLEDREFDKDTRIVIVDFKAVLVGIIADSLTGVIRVPETLLDPTPDIEGESNNCISGTVQLDDQRYILLDSARLLEDTLSEWSKKPALSITRES